MKKQTPNRLRLQKSERRWQDVGHKMKHYCFDRGSQIYLKDSFIGYKEIKADYFSYHFCIPTFMLD